MFKVARSIFQVSKFVHLMQFSFLLFATHACIIKWVCCSWLTTTTSLTLKLLWSFCIDQLFLNLATNLFVSHRKIGNFFLSELYVKYLIMYTTCKLILKFYYHFLLIKNYNFLIETVYYNKILCAWTIAKVESISMVKFAMS